MSDIQKVQGILWNDGVICNAKWAGVRLRDVLLSAGIDDSINGHVCFASHVTLCQDDSYYGGSIPIEKAMGIHDDVLLAYDVRIESAYVAGLADVICEDER